MTKILPKAHCAMTRDTLLMCSNQSHVFHQDIISGRLYLVMKHRVKR